MADLPRSEHLGNLLVSFDFAAGIEPGAVRLVQITAGRPPSRRTWAISGTANSKIIPICPAGDIGWPWTHAPAITVSAPRSPDQVITAIALGLCLSLDERDDISLLGRLSDRPASLCRQAASWNAGFPEVPVAAVLACMDPAGKTALFASPLIHRSWETTPAGQPC